MTTPATRGVRALALLLLASVTSVLLAGGPMATAASADGPVTVSGTGPFSSLKVTVDQTTNLVNQVVHITWSGGQPTQGQANFLQIMQCWGDEPTGPTREQCQFGGFQNQLGGWASTRQVYYGGSLTDTNETYLPPPGSGLPVYVPFHAVDNDPDVELGNTNKFFDANTTNEIARGVTYADGTGEAYFQVQTAREAPGLGCGAAVDDVTTPAVETTRHGCYLVIVPRGANELPGITSDTQGGVQTSPLSATNWAQRIVVPLTFQPIGTACSLGATEAPVYGTELATDAIGSWQPALCDQTSKVYAFTQVPDDLARTITTSNDPSKSGLGLVGGAVPPDQAAGASLVYAPLTVSAIGFGFLIERNSIYGAGADVRALNGRRIEQIKLTPRLAAKLLTQSYIAGSPGRNPATEQTVTRNGVKQIQPLLAQSLGTDPEFLALNPDLVPLQTTLGSAIVPYIPADSVALLWTWINADKDARAFLNGAPDTASPWFNDCGQNGSPSRCTQPIDCSMFVDSKGFRGCPTYVNPNFKALALPLNVVPKLDNHCFQPDSPGWPPQCNDSLFPYANGFADAANAVSRGDSLARTSYNGISYSKGPVQFPGTRNLIALTDTASAERYSLVMASLRNGAGQFVAPTQTAMSIALSTMKADSASVLVPDPTTKTSGAYPLTTVTYAVVNRNALTSATRLAYSDFLTFAATTGQQPGTTFGSLPAGYVPLPATLKQQALSAAITVSTPVPPPSPTPTPTPTYSTPTTSGGIPVPATGGGAAPATDPSATAAVPAPGPTPSASRPVVPTVTPSTQPVALTQPVSTGAAAYGLAVALLLGAGAAVGAVLALGLASRGRP